MLVLHQRTQVRHQHLRNLVHDDSGIYKVLARVSLPFCSKQSRSTTRGGSHTVSKELKPTAKSSSSYVLAGIQDKGSALASLDDAEVARIKEFVAGKIVARTGEGYHRISGSSEGSCCDEAGRLCRSNRGCPSGQTKEQFQGPCSKARPTWQDFKTCE